MQWTRSNLTDISVFDSIQSARSLPFLFLFHTFVFGHERYSRMRCAPPICINSLSRFLHLKQHSKIDSIKCWTNQINEAYLRRVTQSQIANHQPTSLSSSQTLFEVISKDRHFKSKPFACILINAKIAFRARGKIFLVFFFFFFFTEQSFIYNLRAEKFK